MVKDKYGYDIPPKKTTMFDQGSGPALEKFKGLMQQIIKIAEDAYPEERMIQNKYNLMLSCVSEMMQKLLMESISRHEKGEVPCYAYDVYVSEKIRSRMMDLVQLFQIQEIGMMAYLTESPELLREENEHLVKKTLEIGEPFIADLFKKRFDNTWTEAFKNDTKNR